MCRRRFLFKTGSAGVADLIGVLEFTAAKTRANVSITLFTDTHRRPELEGGRLRLVFDGWRTTGPVVSQRRLKSPTGRCQHP